MYISLHLLYSIMYTMFFELQLKFLFILNLVSGFLKGIGFTFYNYITFCIVYLCIVWCFFSNVEEVRIFFQIFGLSRAFNYFCCV